MLQKHCVLQWCLIATIKKTLFFLGFSSSGEGSGSPNVTKTLCFTMVVDSNHSKTTVFIMVFKKYFRALDTSFRLTFFLFCAIVYL